MKRFCVSIFSIIVLLAQYEKASSAEFKLADQSKIAVTIPSQVKFGHNIPVSIAFDISQNCQNLETTITSSQSTKGQNLIIGGEPILHYTCSSNEDSMPKHTVIFKWLSETEATLFIQFRYVGSSGQVEQTQTIDLLPELIEASQFRP